jgi:hypothetical protein
MSAVVEGGQGSGRREVLCRVLVLLAVAAAGVVTGRVAVLVLDGAPPLAAPSPPPAMAPGPPEAPSQDAPGSGRSVRSAAAVLHQWDADRAAAYARGDPGALRRLYTRGSAAGVRDLRVLHAYVERGLVVRGLRTQVLSLRVLTADPGRLRLEVTDRLLGGRAVTASAGRTQGLALPRDAPTTRLLVLQGQAGEWRMTSVQGT